MKLLGYLACFALTEPPVLTAQIIYEMRDFNNFRLGVIAGKYLEKIEMACDELFDCVFEVWDGDGGNDTSRFVELLASTVWSELFQGEEIAERRLNEVILKTLIWNTSVAMISHEDESEY